MAEIHAELANHSFDKIGRLFYDEVLHEFSIGPDIEIHKGSWTSSLNYFTDAADHAFRLRLANLDHVHEQSSVTLPLIVQELIHHYCRNTSGPFRLCNTDFGSHNVLVNDKFEVVGVIDWGGLMAAPVELVAQFPSIISGVPGPTLRQQYRQFLHEFESLFQVKRKNRILEYIQYNCPTQQYSKDDAVRDMKDLDINVTSLMPTHPAGIVLVLQMYRHNVSVEDRVDYLLRLLAETHKDVKEQSTT
jgi:Phosphotransferase enzyme family